MAVPLVKQAFSDPHVRIVFRATDKNWLYEKRVDQSVTGFNPFASSLYVSEHSATADWIRGGCVDDRKYNEADHLVSEVLFIVHDYLHAWTYNVIQAEFPELQLGHGAITRDSLDRFAFCHIVTEAVATVGLDYWYLSMFDLDSLAGIGTCLRSLASDYREEHLNEFRKFDPSLEVQTPKFFDRIANFYCTGEFDGFSTQDLRESAKLNTWIQHELTYGETQRFHIRNWLAYLSNGAVSVPGSELSKPIVVDQKWQRALIRKVGALLWRKVKDDEMLAAPSPVAPSKRWRRKLTDAPDFRFTNLNTFDSIDENTLPAGHGYERNFGYFANQWLSAHRFDTFPKDDFSLLRYVLEKRDLKSLLHLFRKSDVARVRKTAHVEPSDLFFPA